MIRAGYMLIDSFNKLKRIASTITEKHDVETLKRRIDFESKNTITYFNEILSTFMERRVDRIFYDKNVFTNSIDQILDKELPLDIKEELYSMLSKMPNSNEINDLDQYDLIPKYRGKHDDDDYSVVINQNMINKITSKIKTYRKLNMLDCRMKNGVNGEHFKRMLSTDVDLYGMEADSALANIAKKKDIYKKIAKGGLNYSKCSNKAFDIVLHVPHYQCNAEFTINHALKAANEAMDIRKITPYLQYGGVLIYSMLKYRLNTSMMTFISKNFSNVSVLEESTDPAMIVIVAQRKEYEDEPNEEIFAKLREISIDKRVCDSLDSLMPTISIEGNFLEIDIFRGSVLDREDIIDIIADTKLVESFMNKQTEESVSANQKQQPLLPFNLGQIGLVLTSGCLDGDIEELPGQSHVIKGAVKKESIVETIKGKTKEEDETITTYVNKVQIKILTPDGTIKTLA